MHSDNVIRRRIGSEIATVAFHVLGDVLQTEEYVVSFAHRYSNLFWFFETKNSIDTNSLPLSKLVESICDFACSKAFTPVVAKLIDNQSPIHTSTFDISSSLNNGTPIDTTAAIESILKQLPMSGTSNTTSAFMNRLAQHSAYSIAALYGVATQSDDDKKLFESRQMHLTANSTRWMHSLLFSLIDYCCCFIVLWHSENAVWPRVCAAAAASTSSTAGFVSALDRWAARAQRRRPSSHSARGCWRHHALTIRQRTRSVRQRCVRSSLSASDRQRWLVALLRVTHPLFRHLSLWKARRCCTIVAFILLLFVFVNFLIFFCFVSLFQPLLRAILKGGSLKVSTVPTTDDDELESNVERKGLACTN